MKAEELAELIPATLPQPTRTRALRRLAIVADAQALYADGRKPPRETLLGVAARHDISVGTLYRWLASYRRDHCAGLVDIYRQTKSLLLEIEQWSALVG